MQLSKYKNPLLLFITALIWGTAFVAQSQGMDYVDPYTFNAVRNMLGALALVPVIIVIDKMQPAGQKTKDPVQRKNLLIGGTLCGIVLCAASNLQQFGIQMGSEVGKAGFITACYIIIVPLLGLFIKKKCPPTVWLGVVLAVVGLYLLCIKENFYIQSSDILIFLCAIFFAVHILVIDKYTMLVSGIKMSCIQFFVCGLLSGVLMLIFEEPQLSHIIAAWKPIVYTGVFSCGVAYTLQIVGQRGVNPTVASLILSLESVISVLAGWIILNQELGSRELIGCGFMFIAIILVECLPPNFFKNFFQNQ